MASALLSDVEEITTLEQQRVDLHDEIESLPPMAHRRIVLESRLQQLTARQLQLELKRWV